MSSVSSPSSAISTLSLSDGPRTTVQRLQAELQRAQTELSSGSLADPGLVLGGRSGAVAALGARQASLQAITDTNGLALTKLDAAQQAVTAIASDAQSFLGSLISESGVAASPSIAGADANASLKTLTSLLNTTANGEYVFGGINSAVKPVAEFPGTPPSALKSAIDSAFRSTFGFPTSDPAAAGITAAALTSFIDTQVAPLFGAAGFKATVSSASNVPTAATIAEGESVETGASANAAGFRQIYQAYVLVSEFSTGTFSAAAYRSVLDTATATIAAGQPGLSDVATGLGLSQSRISAANDRLSLQSDAAKTALAALTDVDPYALSTRISALTTQIETAYTLTSKIQKLSLLDYL